MIELTQEQRKALDSQADKHLAVVDPHTGQEYVLIQREAYEQMQRILKPYNDAWDDPSLDVYEEYRDRGHGFGSGYAGN